MTNHTGSVNSSSHGGLLVLHLEHTGVAAPADGLRAGDDLARSAADVDVQPRGGNALPQAAPGCEHVANMDRYGEVTGVPRNRDLWSGAGVCQHSLWSLLAT